MKALTKDPFQRFERVQTVADALTRAAKEVCLKLFHVV